MIQSCLFERAVLGKGYSAARRLPESSSIVHCGRQASTIALKYDSILSSCFPHELFFFAFAVQGCVFNRLQGLDE